MRVNAKISYTSAFILSLKLYIMYQREMTTIIVCIYESLTYKERMPYGLDKISELRDG